MVQDLLILNVIKILKYTDRQWEERSNLEEFNVDDEFYFDHYYWDLIDDKEFKEETNIKTVSKEKILGGMILSLNPKKRKNVYWRFIFEKHSKLFAERFWVCAERMCKKGTVRITYGWLDQLEKRFSFHIRKFAEAVDLYDNDEQVLKMEAKMKIINYSGFGSVGL